MQVSPKSSHSGRPHLPVLAVLVIVALAFASSVFASGWPPFTRDDEIQVFRGGTATVLVGGLNNVLANDFDLERDQLTATLVDGKDVKEGTLQLNEDGTFIYTHDGGKKDKDEFKYRAFDGTGSSRETTVRISIEIPPNNPPFTIGSPSNQEATEGKFYRLELASYFGDIDEDDTLTFSASGLPKGNRLSIDSNSGVLSGTPGGDDVDDKPYKVKVTAKDDDNASASLEFELLILEEKRADLSLTSSVIVNPVVVGEATQWKIVVRNAGPADLEDGEMQAQWATNGPALSLSAPQDCSLESNNSSTPSIRCSIDGLEAGKTKTFNVSGTQNSDGDNSLLAVALSDDPNPDDNSMLTGSVVVSAFSEGPAQIIDASGEDVVSGDLNGDGAVDIVVSGNQTRVFFNGGNRRVTTPGKSLGSGSGGKALALLDWDGDNDLDIAVAGMNQRAGRIYLNDGSGGFSSNIDLDISAVGNVNAAAASDFNLDGSHEVVLAGSADVLLVRASGSGGFATSQLPVNSGIHASVADLNSDGFDDIIIVQAGSRRVRLLTNSGNGRSFSGESLSLGSVSGAAAADVDRDGDIDLLLAVDDGEFEVPESRVMYQKADGSFTAGELLGASPLRKILSGDVDKDGIADAVAVNASGVHQVYRGLRSGGFSLAREQIVSDGIQRGILVDFNGDGSLDLILAGKSSSVVEIHANKGNGQLGLGDVVPPTIKINGAASMSLAAGASYVEPGATATDDIDGDVTDLIVISGEVNTSVVGSYKVTYTAYDKAANRSVATRTVAVGVNEGTGGGGGGVVTLASVWFLFLLALFRRSHPSLQSLFTI